ncbi:MAG: hypothetical protein AAF160_11820 [Pseudomonadota bacterium]
MWIRVLIAVAFLAAPLGLAPPALSEGIGFRGGFAGQGVGSAGSRRVAAVQAAPPTAGRLGASIRSVTPSFNNGPGLERPRARPGRGHRRPGRFFKRRRFGFGFPYGFGVDTGEPDIVVVTPPPEPEEPEAEPEPDPMPLAQPKRLRVGGGSVDDPLAATVFAVTLEAEGANAGTTAQRLAEQRDTLVAALVLAGADFCVAREGGLSIERAGVESLIFRGTLDLDLRAADTEGLLLAIAGLPPETIASIREDAEAAVAEEPEENRRKLVPAPGRRCV